MRIVIPPYLFLVCVILMIILRLTIVLVMIIPTPFNYFGILLMILGLAITIQVSRTFERINTEIHTFKTPKRMITSGLFRVSRNPIYLGFVISLIGLWIFLGSLFPLLGCIAFIILCDKWYIPFEEENLEHLFGKDYLIYKTKVRRWI